MTASSSMLVLEDVSRHFNGVAALDGVSLEIGTGQIVCLVGHSGCGKSTLLRTIAGVEVIDTGRILIGGVEVAGGHAFVEPEHRRVGFMFQDYALFPHLNVRQNIAFGLSGLPRDERNRRLSDIIERIGLGALADRYPHMLSGGEQQRVALARALAPRPGVLLMDEPFSNLDRGLREKVRHETLSIVRELGTTAVIVTHDPEEALAIGDLVALMQKGRLIETGTGDRIFDAPWTSYSAAFFSRVNVIPARLTPDGLETPLGRFPAQTHGERAPSVLLRPQSISIGTSGIGAQVLDRSILGEIEEITLMVEGMDEPLIMRGTARHEVRPGDQVFLNVNADQLLIFPQDSSRN